MHHQASPEIFRRANELRKSMTQAESILWERLRAGRLNNYHFRRQHPMFKYILDFYCHQFQLVIEVDGEVHQVKDQIQRDFGREEDLKSMGLKVIRFSNDFVLNETQEVLRIVLTEIEEIKSQV